MRKLPVALGAAAIALVAVAAAAIQATPVTIKPAAGKTIEWNSTSNVSLAISGMMEQTNDTKSTSVTSLTFGETKDGWTKFEQVQKDIKSSSAGGEMPGMMDAEAMQKMLEKAVIAGEVNALGQVRGVSIKGVDANDPMAQMALGGSTLSMESLGLLGYILKEGAMNPGDTWTGKFPIGKIVSDQSGGMVSSNMEAPVTFKFEGIVEYEGQKVAYVTSKTTGSGTVESAMGGGGSMSTDGTTQAWLSLEDGLPVLVKTTSKTTLDLGMVAVVTTIENESKRK